MSLFRGEFGPFKVLASGVDGDALTRNLAGSAALIEAWDQPIDNLDADLQNLPEGGVVAKLLPQARQLGLPSLLPVSIGALADRIISDNAQGFEGDTAFVCIGGITSLYRRRHSDFVLHPEWAAEALLEPLLAFGSVGISRGLCLAGQISPLPWPGFADVVGTYARNAATAALAGFAIAGACLPQQFTPGKDRQPHLDPDETWEGLAPSARLASTLRQDGIIHAAAVSLRGRGRVIGSLNVDPLNRFRASVWR